MTARLVSIALALLLLVTQQLGLQHLLSHGLQAQGAAAVAGTAAAPGGPVHGDAAADGLCQACLSLVVLGAVTLPALLQAVVPALRTGVPAAPAGRRAPRPARAPYAARGPPLRA